MKGLHTHYARVFVRVCVYIRVHTRYARVHARMCSTLMADKENMFPAESRTPSVDQLARDRKVSCPDIGGAKFNQVRGDLDEVVKHSSPALVVGEEDDLEALQEQLQQALDDKAELIEESILDKERILEQRETIELLTRRIREFEMSRNSGPMPPPVRTRSSASLLKQLGDDNIQMAREMDRLIADRDRLERKLIDMKIRYANGVLLTRQNSVASTDEEEEDAIFSTLTIDKQKPLGNKKGVLSRWFTKKTKATKPNEVIA